ncbi:MAG: DinB family protein [Chloroflexi bacterium]|uniref:DinB family protein n=1 Tax=Candidatus Chlorohelix allophototropha TaxID=3003348 RepID=A0A8T7M8A5_9CHLR|nr:DinB family protein [Chloroflexota bacterium]WJW68303.1 DinB family protein [Chloroflexota bacterium L227-S17]
MTTTQPDLSDRKTRLKYKMEEARRDLVDTIKNLTDEQLKLPTANPGWTIYDMLCHITGAEGGMEIIAQRILSGEQTMVEGFDINRFNAGQVKKRQGKLVADMIEELNQSRARMMAVLDSATDEQLSLRGQHPAAGEIDLYGLYVVIYRHERDHTENIKEALAAAGK